ncbi:hypothetical protein GCM10023188_47310 [Pontibacter saemangeumensis]|uniref:Adenylate kinase n=1 Tax=Pontibacter saemangeumensis TaxID=1084525 RepID=A0ABP8M9F1_9BACT
MINNIMFVGGIHGVGKSTVCNKICEELGFKYLSASEVLKWKDINEDEKNKKVQDIPYTQDRLIRGLAMIVEPEYKYVLDGHLCLFNAQGDATRVPIQTFEQINPVAIIVITGNEELIKSRLERRDRKQYDLTSLQRMQELEEEYGKEVANVLGIEYLEASNINTDSVVNKLKTISSPL